MDFIWIMEKVPKDASALCVRCCKDGLFLNLCTIGKVNLKLKDHTLNCKVDKKKILPF